MSSPSPASATNSAPVPVPRAVPWVSALCVAALALLGLAVRGVALIDLEVYRWGAQQVVEGRYLYDGAAPVGPPDGLPFTYPPFAALLFLPLAAVPAEVAAVLLVIASSLGLVVVVRRALAAGPGPLTAVPGRRGVLLAAAVACGCLLLEPVWQTHAFGQVNLVLAGLVAADLLRRGDRPWRGVWVGVAAGIKLTPLYLVAWLLLSRQWRAAGVAVAAALGTVGVSALALPREAASFWAEVLPETGRIGAPGFVSNQSLKGLVARIVGDDSAVLTPWWFVIAAVVGLGLALAAARLVGMGQPALGLWVAALGMLLASPVSWSHHWVWVAPLALTALGTSAGRVLPVAARWAAGALVGATLLGVIWWVPHRDGREMGWNAWQAVLGNAYVLLGLVVAAALVPMALAQARELLADPLGRGRP